MQNTFSQFVDTFWPGGRYSHYGRWLNFHPPYLEHDKDFSWEFLATFSFSVLKNRLQNNNLDMIVALEWKNREHYAQGIYNPIYPGP